MVSDVVSSVLQQDKQKKLTEKIQDRTRFRDLGFRVLGFFESAEFEEASP